MKNTQSAVCINQLKVSFNGRDVIRDLSFSMGSGEKLALTGPSGSGKTTLLNAILGFQPFSRGKALIFGYDVSSASDDVRKMTAYMPQDFNLPVRTAEELFYYPFTFKTNHNRKPEKQKTLELLEKLGLDPVILKSSLSEISGGQKQRILLASAIMLRKPLLLLDEPVSALDSQSAAMVIQLVHSLEDTTVIASTHNLEWAETSGRILRLEPINPTDSHGQHT